jgi:hypothetical protein
MSDVLSIVIGVCTIIAAVASAAAAIYANRLSKRLETMTNTQTFLELERQINEPQMLQSDSAFAKYFGVLSTRAAAISNVHIRLGLAAGYELRPEAERLLTDALAILDHVRSMTTMVGPNAEAAAAQGAAASSSAAQGVSAPRNAAPPVGIAVTRLPWPMHVRCSTTISAVLCLKRSN